MQQHLARAQADVVLPTLCECSRTGHQGKDCQMSGDDHPTERANNTKLDPEEDAQRKFAALTAVLIVELSRKGCIAVCSVL